MRKKIKIWRDQEEIISKRKKIRRALIGSSFVFIPLLLGQIAILILDLLFGTNEIYQMLGFFIWIGHLAYLLFFVPIAILWIIYLRNYLSLKKTLTQHKYSNPELENSILQFLIDNQGKEFTSIEIQEGISNQGDINELNELLRHLVLADKVRVNSINLTPYYSINLE